MKLIYEKTPDWTWDRTTGQQGEYLDVWSLHWTLVGLVKEM